MNKKIIDVYRDPLIQNVTQSYTIGIMITNNWRKFFLERSF